MPSTRVHSLNCFFGFGNKSATTCIWQLVAVDIVANTADFDADTVDFVDFQQSRPCWIQLCR